MEGDDLSGVFFKLITCIIATAQLYGARARSYCWRRHVGGEEWGVGSGEWDIEEEWERWIEKR